MDMRPPVFVVGSERSGTTLLHHMLLSAGGFALYKAETHVFTLLVPRFGDLRVARNRRRLLEVWLPSALFRLSGLCAEVIERRVLAECSNGGDLLRIFMEEIARAQRVDRWVEHTPAHVLFIPEIKRHFPNALVIHVIRDGRDVALSLGKLGWIQPFPWRERNPVLAAGLYWAWIVRKGREYGRQIQPDYLEVRYEHLMQQARPTLARLSEFIGHDLNYERIQEAAIGSVGKANTAFTSELSEPSFNPVGRWQRDATGEDLSELESHIGDLLDDLGYGPAAAGRTRAARRNARRALYFSYFDTKLWLKRHTRLFGLFGARRDRRLA